MLTDRKMQILTMLIEADTAITMKALARHFSLSERSIRYDLDGINETLNREKLSPINKDPQGRLSLLQPEAVQRYLDSLQSVLPSGDARRKKLLARIAFTGTINLTKASKELQVSRGSIKNDIEKIKKKLDQSHLALVPCHKKGLALAGKEADIRALQLQMILDLDNAQSVDNLFVSPIVSESFADIDDTAIDAFFYQMMEDLDSLVSDAAYQKITAFLRIMVKRNQLGHTLPEAAVSDRIEKSSHYQLVKKNMALLASSFGIELNHHEAVSIAKVFMESPSFTLDISNYENWFELETLVMRLISDFSHAWKLDLTDDKELAKDLITFLKPVMLKREQLLHLSQEQKSRIQTLYPKAYGILFDLLQQEAYQTLDVLGEEKATYFTIFFKNAIERNKFKSDPPQTVLLVCGLGYGTSKLVSRQLKQNYEINIIDSIPVHYVKRYKNLDAVDLVITTTMKDFPEIDPPVIEVKPILSATDLRRLDRIFLKRNQKIRLSTLLKFLSPDDSAEKASEVQERIKDVFEDLIVDDVSQRTHGLLHYLQPENIRVKQNLPDWRSAIAYAGEILFDQGFVKKGYIQALQNSFERYGTYMLIKDDIAIPHAKADNQVLATGVALLLLDQPVPTPFGKPLRMIFAFSSADQVEHLEALSEFSTLLLETNFVEKSSYFQTPAELHQFVEQEMTNLANQNK